LDDGRRLLFLVGPQWNLHLLDTETKAQKEILSSGPDSIYSVCVLETSENIYLISGRSEADIWMLTLDEKH